MEFLGLATLIITNIDSVALVAPTAVYDEEVEIPTYAEDDAAVQAQDNGQYPVGEPMLPVPKKNYGKACLPSEPCAATSNQTLIKWLPGKFTIEDLRNASEAEKLTCSRTMRRFAMPIRLYGLSLGVWAHRGKN